MIFVLSQAVLFLCKTVLGYSNAAVANYSKFVVAVYDASVMSNSLQPYRQ